jgi:tetratricopeptide (TPR) repeat protein
MLRTMVLLVGGLASLSAVSVFAQEAALGQQYGSGVYAYFSGDAPKAYDILTSVIDHGSKDPRAFYFRGLAYIKLGRPQEAVADFRKGAELESKDINRFYNVGKALERIQGADRVELENYRVAARMAAYEAEENLKKARYEAVRREEERVVREQAVLAPEKPIDQAELNENAEEVATPDPFAVPAGAKKAGKAPAAGDDPFANPPKKSAAKKEPAAGAKKPDKKPAAEKAPADDSDPFKGDRPEAKKKPAADKPPAPAADDTDPFKNEPDAKKKPADKKSEKKPEPKGDSADPFAP